jgi:polar amino acid transport system substrate-binding protein
MRRITRATAFVAALALAVTACGGNDDAADDPTEAPTDETEATDDAATDEDDADAAPGELDLVTDGTLTTCTDAPYEPFEFEDPDSPSGYSGFDIDLVTAIAETAGLEVAVVNTGFDSLTSGAAMAAGTCDMASSAITITEARAENIDFSDPYYDAIQSLLVPTDSDIASIADLTEGVNVGVQTGTTGEEYANENVPGGTVIAFEGGGDLFTALEAGQIEAILQDEPVNQERANQDENVQVIETFDTGESYGFALQQDRGDDLLQVINDGLQQLRDDGTYDEIYERYFAVAEE